MASLAKAIKTKNRDKLLSLPKLGTTLSSAQIKETANQLPIKSTLILKESYNLEEILSNK